MEVLGVDLLESVEDRPLTRHFVQFGYVVRSIGHFVLPPFRCRHRRRFRHPRVGRSCVLPGTRDCRFPRKALPACGSTGALLVREVKAGVGILYNRAWAKHDDRPEEELDGIHDLGGKQGFGPIEREQHEPAFHQRWEARVFSLMAPTFASGACRNVDQFRHAIERIDPRAYLTHGYYGRWLGGFENLLVEAGVLEREEIDARARDRGAPPDALVAARPSKTPDDVSEPPTLPGNERVLERLPRFAEGDRVRARPYGVPGHTRLPTYARGKLGTVAALHQGWVYPDSNAHGRGEDPQHLYTVAFLGRELWGEDSGRGLVVHVDLFEPYLSREAP